VTGPLVVRQPAAATDVTHAFQEGRERTLALVASVSDHDLERVHSELMSPLVWDLGHIAAFEDLWLVQRMGGDEMVRPDLANVYDAFETPRAQRGDLPYLRRDEAIAYMEEVRERALDAIDRACDPLIVELVVRHELQHNETMLQAIELARLEYDPPRVASPEANGHPHGLDLIEVPAGPFERGAGDGDFAYDNERPRHVVQTGAFLIGRAPVTNGEYAEFVAAGGYERREWWSDSGWAWLQETGANRPLNWDQDGSEWRLGGPEPLDPAKPVVHVCFHEAEAFARAHDARLPTEEEWEKAATLRDHEGANLFEAGHWGPATAGDPMLGNVWEWTSTSFHPYPGFKAHPYREYSEVFFGDDYRVLRGGSWATSERVASITFRNWDYPQRRQIFAGLRIAKEAT
jgi:iron(II)-dependent oxidoreductase